MRMAEWGLRTPSHLVNLVSEYGITLFSVIRRSDDDFLGFDTIPNTIIIEFFQQVGFHEDFEVPESCRCILAPADLPVNLS